MAQMAGLNRDVVTEIFMYLPLQSLFRCRAVCKLWRDVIDSPFFRKLHTESNQEKEDDDDTVYLQLNYDSVVKVPIKLLESLNLNLEGFSFKRLMPQTSRAKFGARLKGLICFNFYIWPFKQPIVICNPFLGQTKILPFSPILASSNSSCDVLFRDIAIGCDGEFYKVVELMYCLEHRRTHAYLYSSRTDSWRDLGNQSLKILTPIDLSCSGDHFAHLYTVSGSILTFDMKNEVFRTILMPSFRDILLDSQEWRIVAKDGNSFILFVLVFRSNNKLVRIYESSICEEEGISKLSWNHVVDLDRSDVLPTTTPPLWRRDCVILKFGASNREVLFYDYVTRRFIGCFELSACSDFLYYKGTFISP